MTASSLLKKSQAVHLQKGATEEIVYCKPDGTRTQPIKAFVQYVERGKDTTAKRWEECIFSGFELPFKPERKDWIEYGGDEFIVDKWNKQLGTYMIYTLSHTAMKIRRES